MSNLVQVGSAISGVLFVKEQLERAHKFINAHGLPVPIEENDLHKQIIQLERYAGSNYFEKALAKYKWANRLLLTISVLILLVVFGVAGVEYLSPETGLGQQLLDFMFDQFVLSMSIVGGLFAVIIVLGIVRAVRAKQLHGKALNKAWASIVNHVQAA